MFLKEKYYSPSLNKTYLPGSRQVLDAAAVAAYHAQMEFPVVRLLLCDDAPRFKLVTQQLALCWVHDGRHYKKLGVNFYHYISDRISSSYEMLSMAQVITERAEQLNLGASWDSS